MENELVHSSSVIAAYIKRFREQPPASKIDRKNLGSIDNFWWQPEHLRAKANHEEHTVNHQITEQKSEFFNNLSISNIRMSQSSVGSNFDQLSYQANTLNQEDEDVTTISERADRLVQRCEQLLGESSEVIDFCDNLSIESSSSHSDSADFDRRNVTDMSSSLDLTCLKSEKVKYDRVSSVHGELILNEGQSEPVNEYVDDESDSTGTVNSSVFYALSPSTSCLSSVQVSYDALVPHNECPVLRSGDQLTNALPSTVHTVATGHLNPSREDFFSLVSSQDDAINNLSAAYVSGSDLELNETHVQVDEAFVRPFAVHDAAVSDLWRRLLLVRTEENEIRDILSRNQNSMELSFNQF